MGMSDDLEAAIAEGATLVRVGTAVFGPRPYNTGPAGAGRFAPRIGRNARALGGHFPRIADACSPEGAYEQQTVSPSSGAETWRPA
jgi:hypothetical protein